MTATMYYDNDAESAGQWRRGAPPWTSERSGQYTADGGYSTGGER